MSLGFIAKCEKNPYPDFCNKCKKHVENQNIIFLKTNTAYCLTCFCEIADKNIELFSDCILTKE